MPHPSRQAARRVAAQQVAAQQVAAHQVAVSSVVAWVAVASWVADYFLTAKAHFAESATCSLVTIANWETRGHYSVIVAAVNVAKNQP